MKLVSKLVRLSITLLIFLFFRSFLFGQSNEEHILKELEQIEKLILKSEFVQGTIYFKDDSIRTSLLKFKGKRKTNSFLFCVAQTEDSLRVYYPSEISAYRIDEDYFISYENEVGSFFIKQRIIGDLSLYERTSIPSETNFNYYLKFSGATEFYVINPDVGLFKSYDMPNTLRGSDLSTDMITIYVSTGIAEKFDLFAKTYLNKCPEVVNMILSNFLTMDDMPDIVRKYNNCSAKP